MENKDYQKIHVNMNPTSEITEESNKSENDFTEEIGKTKSSSTTKGFETEKIKLFDVEYDVAEDFQNLKTIEEFQSYLPKMDNKLFTHLKADIKKNGMNSPILYIKSSDGKNLVVDGHTRLRAAIELKYINIPSKEIKNDFANKDELILWMIKHQFQQRNLSSVEKLQLAFLSKETIEKKAKANLAKAGEKKTVDTPVDTHAEIAKITGVSRATVVRYSRVINSASEKVKKAMYNGNISISAAAKTLEKSGVKKEQPKIEKKKPEVNMFLSYVEGKKSLNEGKIEVLVIIKDQQQVEMFNSKQIEKFGFLVVDIPQVEAVAKKSVAEYMELF